MTGERAPRLYKALHRIYEVVGPDGSVYIGCTTLPVSDRWRVHASAAAYGRGDCPVLYEAINRFGNEAFSVREVAQARGLNDGHAVERIVMAQHICAGKRLYNSPRITRGIRRRIDVHGSYSEDGVYA